MRTKQGKKVKIGDTVTISNGKEIITAIVSRIEKVTKNERDYTK